MSALSNFEKYLKIISHPDKMIPLTKLEFLNPNDTVAYAVDGTYKRIMDSVGLLLCDLRTWMVHLIMPLINCGLDGVYGCQKAYC